MWTTEIHPINEFYPHETNIFSNISWLFTNTQFQNYDERRIYFVRHFLIRLIVWPLFWYELSPKNYIFFKEKYSVRYFQNNGQTINLIKNVFYKIDSSFIVVSINLKKQTVGLQTTEKYWKNCAWLVWYINISLLFTIIRFVSFYISKLWWKTYRKIT